MASIGPDDQVTVSFDRAESLSEAGPDLSGGAHRAARRLTRAHLYASLRAPLRTRWDGAGQGSSCPQTVDLIVRRELDEESSAL
jgi:hypothetical protein